MGKEKNEIELGDALDLVNEMFFKGAEIELTLKDAKMRFKEDIELKGIVTARIIPATIQKKD